jgi:hypothetical protein
MEAFARLLTERANATTLVESSYGASRGILYGRSPLGGGRVRFIHFVRDGRGFVESELGPVTGTEPGSPWQRFPPVVVARWTVFNLVALLISVGGRGRYLRVRFEDVLLQPRKTLEQVQQFLGIDLSVAIARIEARESLPMFHICAGNRVRLAGALTLRNELAQAPRLSRGQSALFWAMAGWLALAFGYRPGASREASPTGIDT